MSRNVSTNYLNGLTLSNTFDSPVYISPGVTIGSPTGAALVNGAAYFWQVTNASGADVAGYSFGVSLNGAGSVTNRGTVTAAYTNGAGFTYNNTTHFISIKSAGVYVGGGGVTNASTGTIHGGVIGLALGATGSLVNAGAIGDTKTSGGFGVVLTTGGSITNQSGGDISGGNYGVLTDGIATVSNQSNGVIYGGVRGIFMVNGAGSVMNQGSIGGATDGVQLFTGGSANNQAGGFIVGGYRGVLITYDVGTVTNQGDIGGKVVAGIYLAEGGVVTNLSGGTIQGGDAGVIVEAAAATISNQGFIQEQDTFSGQTFAIGGILALKGGSVANSNGGTILGSSYGVDVAGDIGTVTNAGLISNVRTAGGAGVILVIGGSVSNSGTVTSHGYGVLVVGTTAAVSNSGLLASYVTGGGAGAAVLQGGSVTNNASGTIVGEWIGVQDGTFGMTGMAAAMTLDNSGVVTAADGKGDGAAVWIHGPGVVINRPGGVIQGATNGTVVGGPLNGLTNGGFGVVAYYQTTLINFGSIGGSEYAFDASNSVTSIGNRVEMAPGASFGGVVLGAHNTASASLSTLELLSGASVGTVSNFGTQYRNFGNVLLDNGANWVMGGTVASGTNVSFAGAGSLTLTSSVEMQGTIDNFNKNDTIVIEGLVATGLNYAGGVVSLTEASGGPVTFNLPGTFTPTGLTVSNVAGNAEITVTRPQIAGTMNGQTVNDNTTISPFANVSITDLNSGVTQTLTVTLSAAANGQLSNLGGGSYDATTGVYSDSGTTAQVTTALDGLVFTPTSHQSATGQTVTTSFTISDTDSDGTSATDTTSSVITTIVTAAPSQIVNNGDGTSLRFVYNPTSTVAETITAYSGVNATGTQISTVVDNGDGSSLIYAYNPAGTTATLTAQKWSATNPANGAPAGNEISDVVDNSDGTSLLYAYNPTSTVSQTTSEYSGTDPTTGAPTGAQISDVVDNTDGTSLLYSYNPTSGVKQTTSKYSGTNSANGAPTGAQISDVVDNNDGTSILYAYNPTSTVTETASFYSSTDPTSGAPTGRLTSETFDYTSGESSITTYNPDGSSSTINYSGPDGTGTVIAGITQSIVITSAADVSAAASPAASDSTTITISQSDQRIDPGIGNHTIQFVSGATADALVLHLGSSDQVLGFDPATDTLDLGSLLSEARVNIGGDISQLSHYISVVNNNGSAGILFDPAGQGGGGQVASLVNDGALVAQLQTLKSFAV